MKQKWLIKSMMLRVWLFFAGALLLFTLIFGAIIYHITTRDATDRLAVAHLLLLQTQGTYLASEDHSPKDVVHYWLTKNADGWKIKLLSEVGRDNRQRGKKNRVLNNLDLTQLTKNTHLLQGTFDDNPYFISYFSSHDGEEIYLLSYQRHTMRLILLPTALLILILAVLGHLIAAVMARHIVKPLNELERYAQRIAHKQWGPPLAVKNTDEIGRLIIAMNEMQALLKQSEEEQEVFLQSISHDLKTPVAVILGHSQAIIDGVYIESLAHTAEIIREEALRLNSKIKKILYFNTLDYSLENQQFYETFDLANLLTDLLARFEPLAPALHWQLAAKPQNFCGDRESLQVALENILDNAQRFAMQQISMTLTAENGLIEITIFNDGEQIPQEKLTSIFDNLAKGKNGNFGLGLFISKKIISYYQGELTAENLPDGVCFRVKLPSQNYKEKRGFHDEKD